MSHQQIIDLPNLKKIRYESDLVEVLQNRTSMPIVTLLSMRNCDPCRRMKPRFIDFAQTHRNMFFLYICINEFDKPAYLIEKAGNQFPTFMIYYGDYLAIVPGHLERMSEELQRVIHQVTADKHRETSRLSNRAPTLTAAPTLTCEDGVCRIDSVGGSPRPTSSKKRTKAKKKERETTKERSSTRRTQRSSRPPRVEPRRAPASTTKRHTESASFISDSASTTHSARSSRHLYNTTSSLSDTLRTDDSDVDDTASLTSDSDAYDSSDSEDTKKLIQRLTQHTTVPTSTNHLMTQKFTPSTTAHHTPWTPPMHNDVNAHPGHRQHPLPPSTSMIQTEMAKLAQVKQNVAYWNSRTDLTPELRTQLQQQQAYIQACENKLQVDLSNGERMSMIMNMRAQQGNQIYEQQQQQALMQQHQQMMQGMMMPNNRSVNDPYPQPHAVPASQQQMMHNRHAPRPSPPQQMNGRPSPQRPQPTSSPVNSGPHTLMSR